MYTTISKGCCGVESEAEIERHSHRILFDARQSKPKTLVTSHSHPNSFDAERVGDHVPNALNADNDVAPLAEFLA